LPVSKPKSKRQENYKEDISEPDRIPKDEYAPISSIGDDKKDNSQNGNEDISYPCGRSKGEW